MLSLDDLGARGGSKTVRVRGREVAVRGLSAAEVHVILAACPEPAPPLKPDPGRGSLAAPIPDTSSEAWQAECRRARQRQRVMEVAVAVSWKTRAGQEWPPVEKIISGVWTLDLARVYLNGAAAEIEAALSETELSALFQAVREIERGADGEALGN
jgi:hypothetical protein